MKFALKDDLKSEVPGVVGKKVFVVIWTTTPWTIPANLGICLNPDLIYVAVDIGDERLVLAEGLYEQLMKVFENTFR